MAFSKSPRSVVLLLNGESVALLKDARREDMFWWSYEVFPLRATSADLFSEIFWDNIFCVEDGSGATVPGVFAGCVTPKASGERVWLRGFVPSRIDGS
jgi:hypothetical protein